MINLDWQSVGGYIQIRKRDVIQVALLALILLLPLFVRDPSPLLAEFPEAWDIQLREPLDNFQRWTMHPARLAHGR